MHGVKFTHVVGGAVDHLVSPIESKQVPLGVAVPVACTADMDVLNVLALHLEVQERGGRGAHPCRALQGSA